MSLVRTPHSSADESSSPCPTPLPGRSVGYKKTASWIPLNRSCSSACPPKNQAYGDVSAWQVAQLEGASRYARRKGDGSSTRFRQAMQAAVLICVEGAVCKPEDKTADMSGQPANRLHVRGTHDSQLQRANQRRATHDPSTKLLASGDDAGKHVDGLGGRNSVRPSANGESHRSHGD